MFARVLVFLLVIGIIMFALAAAPQPPTDWPSLVLLLISAPFGLASVWKLIVVADWKELLKSGSVYTALSAFFAALGGYVAGILTLPEALGAIYVAIWAIFNRQALLAGGVATLSRGEHKE